MFPEHVANVLQQLSYLSTILIGVCMLFGVKKLIEVYQELRAVSARLDSHVELDVFRFSAVDKTIGQHSSMINDLRADHAAGLAETIKELIKHNDHR